ncbi:MAG: hypothetical protein IJC23_07370 [Bacteroidaceae bacterium]|nr:hypothetical protein [Bacteroidaceae bacterium]
MKKNFLYIALAGVALLLSGCSEDLVGDYVQPTEKHFGEEIMFGGSASYDVDSKGTRTIYGGYGEIADGKEPIYWISTDEVRLYCPDASVNTADYTVSDIDDTKTQAGLIKKGDAGLQWGVPTDPHTFYGVYPIPADNSLKEGTTLTGVIPDVQGYNDYTTTDGNVVYNPNMEYAYMVAKTVVPNPNNIGENVYLKFMPIATAVEIELKNNAPTNDANEVVYNFREVHLSSSDHYLSGSFTANLDNMTMPTGNGVRYATASPTGITYVAADQSKQVAVKLYKTDGTAMPLSDGKTLKFTVFMLPSSSADASVDDAIEDLKITIVTSEGNKTGTLSGISVKKSKKTYMHAIPLGEKMTYNQSEWLKYVEDEKKFNELSIPGAGGAASGNVFGTNADLQDYYEQSLSIEDLWKVGIRCFEFTVDCDYAETGGNIADNPVYCNGQDCGISLESAVGRVKTLLIAHPKEFAMVIITYQHKDGWGYDRSPDKFQEQLNTFWANVRDGKGTDAPYNAWENDTYTGLYSSTMTMKEARGKLFCISRPSSLGEDNGIDIESTPVDAVIGDRIHYEVTGIKQKSTSLYVKSLDEHILAINGWGALKDKWVARGYSPCVFHRGTKNGEFKELINSGFGTMMGYADGQIGRPVDIQTTQITDGSTLSTLGSNYVETLIDGKAENQELTPNFFYDYQVKDNEGTITKKTQGVWAQEWARVSDTDGTFTLEAKGKDFWGNDTITDTYYMQWSESMCEKKKRVEETLNYSLSGKIGDVEDIIFINSLCGYYIDRTKTGSTSAYFNGLTDYNAYYEYVRWRYRFCVSYLSGQDSKGGMSGNIGKFANDINTYFKGLLDSKLQDGRLGGSTGIVLMDRVSNVEDAGAAIPSIIIANNFSSDYEATDPTAPTSVVTDGDTPLSREGVNIVWGEWE